MSTDLVTGEIAEQVPPEGAKPNLVSVVRRPLSRAFVRFLATVTAMLTVCHLYLGLSLIWFSQVPAPTAGAAAVLLVALWLLIPLAMLARIRGWEGRWAERLTSAYWQWIGVLAVLLLVVAARDLVWLTGWLLDVVTGSAWHPWPTDPAARRELAQASALGCLLVTAILASYGRFQAARTPPARRVRVALPDLPEPLVGFRIVQLSDLHVIPSTRPDWVASVVGRVNQLHADLVAITGDLVDGHPEDLREALRPLEDLRARHGIVFVTGNHEYYWGARRWLREAARLGMRTLVNQHCVIEHDGCRLLVAGITDRRAGQSIPSHRPDPEKALEGAPESDVRVLLAHQPASVRAAAPLGFDLQLSGHTHGGQIWPWGLLIKLQQPVLAGLQSVDGRRVYVSRGTGCWGPPMRLGAPPEIAVIELARAGGKGAGSATAAAGRRDAVSTGATDD